MKENIVNIYSIAYRDCKEVAGSIDVNEEYGKASTILFYMDEILDALKVASELQAIGTIEEFKDLKEKYEPKKVIKRLDVESRIVYYRCPNCNVVVGTDITKLHSNNCPCCGQSLKGH